MTRFGHRDPVARVRRMFDGSRFPTAAPRPLCVVGHRGAARHIPENTIAAFRRAIELGADAIETDVCVTRDDVLVLWHDNEPGDPVSLARGVGAEDFDYLANWPGVLAPARRPVYDMTYDEMRGVCGYSRDRGVADLLGGDRRPDAPFELLDELFAWSAAEPRVRTLFLDVKLRPEDAARAALIEDAVAAARLRDDLKVRLLLPHRELWDALAARPPAANLYRTPDFELPGILEDADELGARHISMGYTKRRTWGDFERELVAVIEARDGGELEHVTVWTVNDEERLRTLVRARVDAVLTDEPALLRRLAEEA